MLELSYLAFQTDSTRVITFVFDTETGYIGLGHHNHHELSHHGGDSNKENLLAEIDRFHISKVARFADFLNRTKEADGTMLDQTMILFGSG